MTVDDAVIEMLCDSELLLRDRVRSLEADIDGYRAVAQQAIHALRHVMVERDQLRAQNRDLRARLRRQVAA